MKLEVEVDRENNVIWNPWPNDKIFKTLLACLSTYLGKITDIIQSIISEIIHAYYLYDPVSYSSENETIVS